MNFESLEIGGVYLVHNFFTEDNRGSFVKTYHADAFKQIGLNEHFKESYYSTSKKNVLRGMHFQTPPYDHEKLVYVTEGSILDVILDLRLKSKTYGKHVSVQLNAFENSVFIPKGCAHGFLTLSQNATVVYNVTTVYNKDADAGILWNSFGMKWDVQNPILSNRDMSFEQFSNYKSPF